MSPNEPMPPAQPEAEAPVTEAVAEPAPVWQPERSSLAEWIITMLTLLFATTSLVQPYVIPSGSMEDNLLIGDHLLVDKLSWSPPGSFSRHLLPYQPIHRGDIVIFRYPVDLKLTFVKRVVGLPGDRLRVHEKTLFLNGKPLTERYKVHKTDYTVAFRDFYPGHPDTQITEGGIELLRSHVKNGEVIVPDNCYFVMGDNRDHSLDSRYWGFVPRRNIIGKPLLIYWSYETTTERLSGFNREHFLDLLSNFFTRTRWRRTFQFIRSSPVE
jgi:signal peptidase I